MIKLIMILMLSAITQSSPQTVEIEMMAPSSAWNIKIKECYVVRGETWVVANLSSSGIGASVISTVRDEVEVDAIGKMRVFVFGKTWKWKNNEGYNFPADQKDFRKMLQESDAQPLEFSPVSDN
jgi:hypothetical protein